MYNTYFVIDSYLPVTYFDIFRLASIDLFAIRVLISATLHKELSRRCITLYSLALIGQRTCNMLI